MENRIPILRFDVEDEFSRMSIEKASISPRKRNNFIDIFPREISELIFDGIPLQLLVPYRLVCKSWDDFISSSPQFWSFVIIDRAFKDTKFLFKVLEGVDKSGSETFSIYNLFPSPTALNFIWPTQIRQLRDVRISVVQSFDLVALLVRGSFPNLETLDFSEVGHSEEVDKSDHVVYDVPVRSECVYSLPKVRSLVVSKLYAERTKIAGPFSFPSRPVICGRRLSRLLRLLPNLKNFSLAGFEIRDCRRRMDEQCEVWEPQTSQSLFTLDFENNRALKAIRFEECLMRILPIIPSSCESLHLAHMAALPQQRRYRVRSTGEEEQIFAPESMAYESERRLQSFDNEFSNLQTLELHEISDLYGTRLAAVLARMNPDKIEHLQLRDCAYLDLGDDTKLAPKEIGLPDGPPETVASFVIRLCQNLRQLDLSGTASDRKLIKLNKLIAHCEVVLLTGSTRVTWFGLAAVIGEYWRCYENPSAQTLSELLKDVEFIGNQTLKVLDISGCFNVTIKDVATLRRFGLERSSERAAIENKYLRGVSIAAAGVSVAESDEEKDEFDDLISGQVSEKISKRPVAVELDDASKFRRRSSSVHGGSRNSMTFGSLDSDRSRSECFRSGSEGYATEEDDSDDFDYAPCEMVISRLSCSRISLDSSNSRSTSSSSYVVSNPLS
ncbi:uncharacterized protein V1516DRAFT_689452 [Lipomyces oligophaga]|uniref:uncharacterized protein n=1 Tax=Lipomyces oligophaga TaxID=45792 RepID=UPI0034CD06AD